MRIIRLKTINSTNAYLKELVSSVSVEEGLVVVAEEQTAGRGQQGASWEALPGENLTFSLLLRPHFLELKENFLISQLVSLAIRNVFSAFVEGISIKWPNDIYYEDKKIGGILIENEIQGNLYQSAIVGIGLNINQHQFYSDAPNPVSLKQITGSEFDLASILEKVCVEILSCYHLVKDKNEREWIVNQYKSVLYRKDFLAFYEDGNGIFKAKIVDVEDSGYLILETDSHEIRKYAFREVAYIPTPNRQ